MFKTLVFLGAALLPLTAFADDKPSTLIFEDDFERTESQEEKDEVGRGWGTNSDKRAKGHKQVDLRDGAMHIFIHKEADHGVSVTHPAEFKDGTIEMRFMLEEAKDSLGINIADLKSKEVHAGHLCAARIRTKEIELQDLKTGSMALPIRTARQAGTLTAEQKQMLKGKSRKFPNPLETRKWHRLRVNIAGETMTVSIDGNEVAKFTSPGIGHATKRTLRLAVPRNAVVDDVKIWRAE